MWMTCVGGRVLGERRIVCAVKREERCTIIGVDAFDFEVEASLFKDEHLAAPGNGSGG